MHQVIITADFAGELANLSQRTKSGRAITHTNEEYAAAVAKVLLLPRDREIEILAVFNARVLEGILDDPKTERFQWIYHLLHHEFCHVHDDNKKLDAMPEVWLNNYYSGKDIYIGPLAETCWSEYAANRLSASTACNACITAMVDSFAEALERTKKRFGR